MRKARKPLFFLDRNGKLVHNTSTSLKVGFYRTLPDQPSQVETAAERALRTFEAQGGILRMAEAVRLGIHRRTLSGLKKAGRLESMGRGLYHLAEAPVLSQPDLVTVAARCPRGVFCLISALAFHQLTREIPHEIHLAIPRNDEPPRIAYPPVRVYRMSPRSYATGIETHSVDGVAIRVYSPEKTMADCFKYRNQLGMETVLDALRQYREKGRIKTGPLMDAARACRVERIMRPYLEAML